MLAYHTLSPISVQSARVHESRPERRLPRMVNLLRFMVILAVMFGRQNVSKDQYVSVQTILDFTHHTTHDIEQFAKKGEVADVKDL